MEIVWRFDPNYNAAKQIANARFDYLHPAVICFCESDDDVREAMRMAKKEGLYVRIRSGGHHHEGMCSGPNVLMIDVSRINTIRVEGDTVRLGPGARLGKVYPALWKAGQLFPGGGCGDVCVGGLVQGGGWGPYGRSLGFTCDRLIWFRIVKADGSILEVSNSPTDPNRELFWAVCGGGGGNFGVITEFLFRPGTLTTPIWSFTAKWQDPGLVEAVIDDWRGHFPGKADPRLTSFARLSAVQGDSPDPPAIVAGFFVGERSDLERIAPLLLPKTHAAAKFCYDQVDKTTESADPRAFQHPEYQPGPPAAAVRALAAFTDVPPDVDLNSTCAGIPYPHKISSCFPQAGFGADAIKAIATYLDRSSASSTVRRYLSLHSLGGAMERTNDQSCFPYRDKPFMLQYQAWWADSNDMQLQMECLAWIAGFRETLQPWTEGAFINFPDRDLVQFPNDDTRRKELLRYYYAGNLERLITVKATYDPDNFFNFEMGIPTS
ncbi:MAG TPA: FAD-binding oxidoreductase [Thermoanaerobaculia bacterium]